MKANDSRWHPALKELFFGGKTSNFSSFFSSFRQNALFLFALYLSLALTGTLTRPFHAAAENEREAARSFTTTHPSPEKRETFTTKDNVLSFLIPPGFSAASTQGEHSYPGLLLALDTSGDFPSLNVIAQPGKVEPTKRSLSILGERIAADYRRTGLKKVSLKKVTPLLQNGITALLATVHYDNSGQKMEAMVLLVPAGELHYFLTFTCQREQQADCQVFSHIQESLTFKAPSAPLRSPKEGSSKFPLPALLLAAALISLGGLWWLRMKRKAPE